MDANSCELEEPRVRPMRSQRLASFTNRPWRGLMTAAAIAVALALAASVAHAQTLNNVAINTGASLDTKVLDVSGASIAVGAPVIEWYPNDGLNQRWDLTSDANGYEHIVNVNSGLCLATNGVPGNVISQWPCTNSTQEDWTSSLTTNPFDLRTGFGVNLVENPESGMFLSVNGNSPTAGTKLIAWPQAITDADQDTSRIFTYTQYP